jgi:phage shock protein C
MGLRRIPERGVVAGVCAGFAEYFDWNVRLLRAALVIAFLVSGFFPIVLAYLVLWYVMDPVAPGTMSGDGGGYGGGDHGPGSPGPGRGPTMAEVQVRFERLDQRLRSIEECVTDKEFELRRELKKLEA